MRRRDLTFSLAREEDLDGILALCRDRPLGAEIYASLQLNGAEPEIGSLWTGRDRKGRLRRIIYDNGAYLTFLTQRRGYAARPPQDGAGLPRFAVPPRRTQLCVMVYRGRRLPFPDDVEEVRGTDLLALYKAVRKTDVLSDAAERRYVARARAVNAGLAESFGMYEDGNIAATASINAKNERYALIGDVFTVFRYRYQGYAARLINACVARAQEQGLTPILYCEKSMRKFYRKLGFVGRIIM